MTADGQLGAVGADSEIAIALVFAVAAGFFAVAAHYYLRISGAAERLVVAQTRQRLRRSNHFLRVPRVGRLLWCVDVVAVVGFRVCLVLSVAPLWFIVTPVLLTIGSIELAASILRF